MKVEEVEKVEEDKAEDLGGPGDCGWCGAPRPMGAPDCRAIGVWGAEDGCRELYGSLQHRQLQLELHMW